MASPQVAGRTVPIQTIGLDWLQVFGVPGGLSVFNRCLSPESHHISGVILRGDPATVGRERMTKTRRTGQEGYIHRESVVDSLKVVVDCVQSSVPRRKRAVSANKGYTPSCSPSRSGRTAGKATQHLPI
jgi:hypothetical protein